MPTVIFAPSAVRDLHRISDFLQSKNPEAAHRAGLAIRKGVERLGSHPRLGRTVDGLPEDFREWIIGFGASGYIARYRITTNHIVILAIRHLREAGFG